MGLFHSFQREGPLGSLLKSDPRAFSGRQKGPAGQGAAQSPADKEGSIQGGAPSARGSRLAHGMQ